MHWIKTLPIWALAVLANNKPLFSLNSDDLIDNECCDLTFADINHLNQRIRPKLADLVQEDYFKHYQFKLDLDCPFFECQSVCFSPGCQLDLDVHSNDYNYDLLDAEGDKLGDINEDSFLDSLCPSKNDEDLDDGEWCDLDAKNGVIIDISRNPERFTGYIPTPEQNIWSMIYQNQLEGECPMEQKVFYQIISGFHSSVSTHLSNEWYNNETNGWEPNLDLFNFKVGDHKDRIANIYFNYALVVRAIKKLSPFLKKHKFNPLNSANNAHIKKELNSILKEFPTSLHIFDEDLMFKDNSLKEEFKQKFKNVTRLMDCVTCDRCRLWGKIQSTGYATSLKVLFTDNTDVLNELTKNEIASLFNVFDRLTKSIDAINNFNYLNLQRKQQIQEIEQEEESITEESSNLSDEEPKSVTSEKPNSEKTIRDRFNDEMGEVFDALRFIWSSYVNLPHNLKNIVLFKLNEWWNAFMGLEPNGKNTEYLHKIVV